MENHGIITNYKFRYPYKLGVIVRYNGGIYENRMNNNPYSPEESNTWLLILNIKSNSNPIIQR